MALLPEDIAGPWAIERSRLDALVRAWRDADPAALAGAVTVVKGAIGGERGDAPLYAVDDGIAVIPVTGPLSKAWSWWMAYFGGSSTQRIGVALEQAVVDPAVRGVLLAIDSPGGQVAGTSDLADAIRDAARTKPVHAYISDCGCSAAYWLASQATRITCNTTAQVGSIGVYTVLVDSSEAAKSLGFAVKVIASGPLKGTGESGAPVTDEQEAEVQGVINALADLFVQAVARPPRRMAIESVRVLADGRVLIGESARAAGLVDEVGTMKGALRALRKEARTMSQAAAAQAATEAGLQALQAALRAKDDEIAGLRAELERTKASAPAGGTAGTPAPKPAEALSAALEGLSPELRAEVERLRTQAADADRLKAEQRRAQFTARAEALGGPGCGLKLPIKADELGALLLRAADNTLTAADLGELERLLAAGNTALGAQLNNPSGTTADNTAGGDPVAEVNALALRKVADSGGKLDLGAAMQQVFAEHPELYARYAARASVRV